MGLGSVLLFLLMKTFKILWHIFAFKQIIQPSKAQTSDRAENDLDQFWCENA